MLKNWKHSFKILMPCNNLTFQPFTLRNLPIVSNTKRYEWNWSSPGLSWLRKECTIPEVSHCACFPMNSILIPIKTHKLNTFKTVTIFWKNKFKVLTGRTPIGRDHNWQKASSGLMEVLCSIIPILTISSFLRRIFPNSRTWWKRTILSSKLKMNTDPNSTSTQAQGPE